MSTDPAFDIDAVWTLDAQVAIRPERFGALLYHFGTRRLSFVKTPTLLAVLTGFDGRRTARTVCAEAGVTEQQLPSYRTALGQLAASSMIRAGVA